MNTESNFETLADSDLDSVAGGRHHRFRNVGVVNSYGYGYGYPAATVPSIVGGYGYASYAAPAYAAPAYPTAYASPYGYAGYGMRLGTAI